MFEWSQGNFHWELLGLRLQPLVLMENPAAARLLDDLVREVTAQATYDLHKFPFQGMYLSRLKASREGSLGPYWAEKRGGITVLCSALLQFGDPAIALPTAFDAPREVLSHKLCSVDIADPLLIF